MSPRVLGVEVGDSGKKHPAREPSDPPHVEFSPDEKSTAAQVATFRSGRYQVGVPATVATALIAAVSAFAVAWAQKPAAVPLTPQQAQQLEQCSTKVESLRQDLTEVKTTVRWLEPQVGVLLARTQVYVPPQPPPSR